MRIAVRCPDCGTRQVDDARELWFIQGMLIATRYGSRRFYGCAPCVRSKMVGNLMEVTFLGWWSMWGVLGTPFVILQNLANVFSRPNESLLRSFLRDVGIDADEVEIDAFGMTREQTRVSEAILSVLAEAIWADGEASADELVAASEIAIRMVGDTFTTDEIIARIGIPTRATIPESMYSNPDRVILLRAALAVVAADGRLTGAELGFLWDLAQRLRLPRAVVDQLLADAGIGDGKFDSGRTPPSNQDLHRAAAILEVAATSTRQEAKAAHRKQAMRYHPDRAGADPAAIQRANARMSELNWAYEQFVVQGAL